MRKEVLYIILAVAITFVVYYDSFNNSFIWDDYPFVVYNKAIRSLDAKSLISFFTDRDTSSNSRTLSSDVYRPLVTASFAIDYRLLGLNPHLYHIENTALHLLNVFLVFSLVSSLFASTLPALLAALIFGIHPVQTEAVTWISGRSNVLFCFFYLAALLAHIGAPPNKRFSLALALFTAGLLAKEMAITLPVVMFLYDAHFPRKQWGLKKYAAYYTPFLAVSLAYLGARWSVVGGIMQGGSYWGSTVFENLMLTLKAVAGYIRLLFLPLNLRADYCLDMPGSIFDPDVVIALTVLTIVAASYAALRRNRVVSFFIAWFFVALIPVCNLVPFKAVMAERFLYLPSIAFAGLAALVMTRAEAFAPKIAASVFAGLLIFYGAGTMARNVDWRNEISLYTSDLARSPGSARFHYNLGFAYCREYLVGPFREKDLNLRAEYYAKAEAAFKNALRLRPDHADSHFYLGNVYSDLGLYDKAIECFKNALQADPGPGIYNNMGIVYYNRKEYDRAIECYKRALSLAWEVPQVGYLNLGDAYSKKREFTKARKAWEAALKASPGDKIVEEKVKNLKNAGF